MKNADVPAMPQSGIANEHVERDSEDLGGVGLTKREYFAAKAMQGLLSNNCLSQVLGLSESDKSKSFMECVKEQSFAIADMMLEDLSGVENE